MPQRYAQHDGQILQRMETAESTEAPPDDRLSVDLGMHSSGVDEGQSESLGSCGRPKKRVVLRKPDSRKPFGAAKLIKSLTQMEQSTGRSYNNEEVF